MQIINQNEFKNWERFYRGNFMNSLSGFKSASLIATVDEHRNPNLAVFSNIVHLGADPALIGFVNRPLDAGGHTLANIESTKFYTINHIHPSFIDKAHHTSAKYLEGENEFEKVGLHEEWLNEFNVPFVKESKIKYGLELQQIIPIELNKTFFVIGKLVVVFVDEVSIGKNGFIDLVKAESVCSSGIDAYHSVNEAIRYAYAKPNQPTQKIDLDA